MLVQAVLASMGAGYRGGDRQAPRCKRKLWAAEEQPPRRMTIVASAQLHPAKIAALACHRATAMAVAVSAGEGAL